MYESTSEALGCRFDAGVLTISFDRPEAENRLNYEVLGALRELLSGISDDDEVRAVVLRGEGDDFCAGDDWPDMGPWPEAYAHRRPGGDHGAAPLPEQDAVKALRAVMKPTIALLRGKALGLGLDLAAVCDLRVATAEAEIGDPRMRQGRAPATGITYLLPRLIGLSQASRVLLLGDVLTGEEAHRIQLVHKVFRGDRFDHEAANLIRHIAALPTRAYEVHKLQVLPQLDMSFEASLTHCLGVRQTHVIEDRAEGARAWLERREPVFKGR